jgi:twitching motility two-component system response regulator PilG
MLKPSNVANNTELCPATALPQLINQLESGRLTFQSPGDDLGWRVHFSNRQLHFASAIEGQQLRLQYLLPQYLPGLDLTQNPTEIFQQDYAVLCQLWQSGRISAQQLRKILCSFTQEALIQLLVMRRATLTVESSVGLDPILISIPLPRLMESVQESVQSWAQFTRQDGEISSPLQRLQILHLDKVLDYWKQQVLQGNLPPVQTEQWQRLTAENWILYAVAQLLRIDVSTLIRHFQLLEEMGLAQIIPYRQPEQPDDRPLIACIDDSKTMRAILRSILEPAGYQVLEIKSATQATSMLAEVQPSVILMDISMPEMDGYELCSHIKRSALKDVPVVMLTGREGVIDRVRARFVGATDYVTKPFDPDYLVNLVQQLILAE